MLQLKHSILQVFRNSKGFQFKDLTGSYSVSNTGGFGSPNPAFAEFLESFMTIIPWNSATETLAWEVPGSTDLNYLAAEGDSTTEDLDIADGLYTSRWYMGNPFTSTYYFSSANTLEDDTVAPAITAADIGKYISVQGADKQKVMKITNVEGAVVTFEPLAVSPFPLTVGQTGAMNLILWEVSETDFLVMNQLMIALAKKLAANCACDDRFKHIWSMLKQIDALMYLGDTNKAYSIYQAAKALVI